VQADMNLELKEKLSNLFPDKQGNREKLKALAAAMTRMGFAEEVNSDEGKYQVTSAFHYIEQMIMCIHIDDEMKDEIPQ